MFLRFLILYVVLISSISAQTQIAVVEFQGKGVSNIEASALTDRLVLELFKTGEFKVLEREMLEKILEEQKFQLSGCTSTECLIEIGRLANVQEIVSGSVSKVGDYFSISARLISVESGEILKVAVFDFNGKLGELLVNGMADISKQLASTDNAITQPSDLTFDKSPSLDDVLISRPSANNYDHQNMTSTPKQEIDVRPKKMKSKFYGLSLGAKAGIPVYMYQARGTGEPVFSPVFEVLLSTPYIKAENAPPLGIGLELGIYDFTGGNDGVGSLGLILLGTVIMSLTDYGDGGWVVELGAGFLNSDLGIVGGVSRSIIMRNYPIIYKPFIKGYSRRGGDDYETGNFTWFEVGVSINYDLSSIFKN